MTENKVQILPETQLKLERLKQSLTALGSAAVAFSSGVDSTFLLKIAHEVLKDKVIAVTARSASFPAREFKEAEEFCRKEGIRQVVFESKELELEGFSQNPPNRCYICKKQLFLQIQSIARENQMSWAVEGSNADDEGDYRPGMQAVAELGVKSPLREARLTKAEIRLLSKDMGLSVWEKPSFACLASRFPYGEPITAEKLAMVGQAEELLLQLGFSQFRVRIHGAMARIEILPEEFLRLLQEEIRIRVTEQLREYGFTYVSMDLNGYRTGSMNETIDLDKPDGRM